jgi:dipeptidase E
VRLYLSSFRLGNQPQRMVQMTRAPKRALVVVNSCDLFPEHERAPKAQQELAALGGLGLEPEELDLRDYFDVASRPTLANRLSEADLLWVRGGNPFVLLRAMKRTGFDALLRDALDRDALVYGGYSAGIAVLTPSLRGIELVDDPVAVPPGYDSQIEWGCLGILPYSVAPHYRSEHGESAQIEDVVSYFIDHHMLFVALRDGEAIVVEGERSEFIA